jgi:hypothetical protein
MARKFHLSNGAVQIQVNETTQNFEYEKVWSSFSNEIRLIS